MAFSTSIITKEMYDVEIPIVLDKSWNCYQYESFARGYHAYMTIWTPLIGESLLCKHEPANIVDKNAVAIIRTDSMGKDSVVGHLPENISKLCTLFLKVPNTGIRARVTGKRLNRGGGYGLEIPVVYEFVGPAKFVEWVKGKLISCKTNLNNKTNKCLK